ncbi:MAG: hypothetical protein WCT77_14205, partial [Bacteroidota bacterium]
MKKLIHFIGLKRSGNHAVINWLLRNISFTSGAESQFYNDVFNPWQTLDPKLVYQPNPDTNSITLLSYEDIPLGQIAELPTIIAERELIPDAEIHKVLLIRDPFNLFASRMKHIDNLNRNGITRGITLMPWTTVKELWKQYAREFLNNESLLQSKIGINYNLWFA